MRSIRIRKYSPEFAGTQENREPLLLKLAFYCGYRTGHLIRIKGRGVLDILGWS